MTCSILSETPVCTREFDRPLGLRLSATSASKMKQILESLACAVGLAVPEKEDREAVVATMKAFVDQFAMVNRVAIRKRAPWEKKQGPEGDFELRTLPLNQDGWRLGVSIRDARVSRWKQQDWFDIAWCAVDGPRGLREHEHVVSGLVTTEDGEIAKEDFEWLQELRSPVQDPDTSWKNWSLLLEAAKAVQRAKSKQIEKVKCRVEDGANDRLILAWPGRLEATDRERLTQASSLTLMWRVFEMTKELTVELNSQPRQVEDAVEVTVRSKRILQPADLPPKDGSTCTLLTDDDQTSIIRMENALAQMCAQFSINPRLKDILMDPSKAERAPGDLEPLLATARDGYPELNDEQRAAVQKAITNPDLTLVLGPPGTGKTSVVAAICAEAQVRGWNVLISSQANTAVDNALARARRMPGMRMVRMQQRDLSRIDPAVHDLLPDRAVDSFHASLKPGDIDGHLPQDLDALLVNYANQVRNAPEDGQDRIRLWSIFSTTATVVGATCSQAAQIPDKMRIPAFDLVIIDEVSKAMPVEMLPALVLAKRVVLIGDDRQLPPVWRDDDRSLAELIKTGDLRLAPETLRNCKVMVDDSFFGGLWRQTTDRPDLRQMLVTQYRMHPRISAAINVPFYDGLLKDGIGEEKRRLDSDLEMGHRRISRDQGIVWMDSSRRGRDRTVGSSRDSQFEADVVADLVETISRRHGKTHPPIFEHVAARDEGQQSVATLVDSHRPGLAWKRDECEFWVNGESAHPCKLIAEGDRIVVGRSLSVGCISLYKAQKDLIDRRVNSQDQRNRRLNLMIKVNTVDSFQGMECDIILVSLVRTGFRPDAPFLTDFRRFNVACSRARKLLVLIGDRPSFAQAQVTVPHREEKTRAYGDIIDGIAKHHGILTL